MEVAVCGIAPALSHLVLPYHLCRVWISVGFRSSGGRLSSEVAANMPPRCEVPGIQQYSSSPTNQSCNKAPLLEGVKIATCE